MSSRSDVRHAAHSAGEPLTAATAKGDSAASVATVFAPPRPADAAVGTPPAPPLPATLTGDPPALNPLSPADVRRGLRLSTLEGATAAINLSITGAVGGSVFLSGFALMLGATNFQLGILSALPFAGQLCQFIGAYLEERLGRRRGLVLYGSLLGRLIWALLLALPFLGLLQGTQLTIFFIGLACSYALNGIAGNAWLSWMSDLVPQRQRGSYFGMRNTVVGVMTMLTTFLAGRLLDTLRADGREASGYALIFGVSILAAIASAALIARQPEPPLRPQARVNLGELLGGPLHDARFRRFVLLASAWALVTGIAVPFFNAYGLNTLRLSFATLALTAIATSAVALIFTPLIGRLQDRLGDRTVLVACMFGTVLLPWGWVLSTPTNIVPLWLTSIFSGVFWPGVTQGMINLLMDRAPAAHRGAAMATHSAVSGLGALIAGVLGGVLATLLVGSQVSIGPFMIVGLAMIFALTSLGRLVVAVIFLRML